MYSVTGEFFKLKANMVISSPNYMIYNDMLREAMEEVLQSKHRDSDDEDSSNTLLST